MLTLVTWNTLTLPGYAPRCELNSQGIHIQVLDLTKLYALQFERHYSIDDAHAALVFPAGVAGYLVATASANYIQLRKGRRGIALVASASRIAFALLLSSAPAFPFFLAGFVIFGYGTGLTDTTWNAWASGMSRPNVVQGILHGSFSVGCVTGPVLASLVLRRSSWPLLYSVLVRYPDSNLKAKLT
jgi:fucose permease